MEKLTDIIVVHGPSIELLVNNPTSFPMIDKGAHGAVFRLSHDRCVKIYAEEVNAGLEASTYKRAQISNIVPRFYEAGKNYVIMEFIEGITLSKYLWDTRNISNEIAQKLVSLLKEMRQLGFTRIDTSLRHVFITGDGSLKVLDLVYAYVRHDDKPKKVFTELEEIGLLSDFMRHVKQIDRALYDEWKLFAKEFINKNS